MGSMVFCLTKRLHVPESSPGWVLFFLPRLTSSFSLHLNMNEKESAEAGLALASLTSSGFSSRYELKGKVRCIND
jgi:hypothetical protein